VNRFLYRYYGKDEHILDVLLNKRLYHCKPSQFNDPFDCRPLISIKYSRCEDEDIWRKFLFYLAKMEYPEAPAAELSKHADAAFAKGLHRNQSWLSEVDEGLKDVGGRVRVCCFSKSPRNMMMWAHYAKNHSGLVFQFRTSELRDAATGEYRGQDVQYVPGALGVQDYVYALEQGIDHGNVLEMSRIIYSTKTVHWEHEEEVRFFTEKDHPYASFKDPALSGIIFGDKTSELLIRRVRDIIARWKHRPYLFKASIEKSSHKLWIGKYNGT
jgi:hypothetical protein